MNKVLCGLVVETNRPGRDQSTDRRYLLAGFDQDFSTPNEHDSQGDDGFTLDNFRNLQNGLSSINLLGKRRLASLGVGPCAVMISPCQIKRLWLELIRGIRSFQGDILFDHMADKLGYVIADSAAARKALP